MEGLEDQVIRSFGTGDLCGMPRLLLSVLLAFGGCATAVPVDALRDATFAVENFNSVYLMDGSGEQVTRILERRQTRDGPGHLDRLYDDYVQPSLSPDGTHIACIRRRNDSLGGNISELMPLQSSEVLVVRVSDRVERLVMSVPATRPGRIYRVSSPVWSTEGGRVFFFADRRVWSYSLDEARLEALVDLPIRYVGGLELIEQYLRVSRDGARLFALFFAPYQDVVMEIDLADRKVKTLWSGKLSSRSVFDVDRPLPRELGEEVAQALFGSREFPVYTPQVSGDRRSYFFMRHKSGWFGRIWVAGYDRETRTEFEVRTMWRTLFWK